GDEQIFTAAALEVVAADPSDQQVATIIAAEDIAAPAPEQNIALRVSAQRIAGCPADDVFEERRFSRRRHSNCALGLAGGHAIAGKVYIDRFGAAGKIEPVRALSGQLANRVGLLGGGVGKAIDV